MVLCHRIIGVGGDEQSHSLSTLISGMKPKSPNVVAPRSDSNMSDIGVRFNNNCRFFLTVEVPLEVRQLACQLTIALEQAQEHIVVDPDLCEAPIHSPMAKLQLLCNVKVGREGYLRGLVPEMSGSRSLHHACLVLESR